MNRRAADEAASSPPRTRRIVVFARAPVLGQVKTRLAADLGPAAALDVYRRLGRHAVAEACEVRDADVIVQFTPTDGATLIVEWLGDRLASRVSLRPQADGDLGARMAAAITEGVEAGAAAVVVIGTDCPTMEAAVIERACALLAQRDVVLGPALDGGYYLIAVRTAHRALFDGIPWSADDTLARTLDAAHGAGLRTGQLDPRADIDSGADWRRWQAAASSTERSHVLGPLAPSE